MAHSTGRAHGRICLLGEHCDWAGGASLAVPIRQGVTVRWQRGGDALEARSGGRRARWTLPPAWKEQAPLRYLAAVVVELSARGIEVGPGALEVQATLPEGRGLSSSAALCVATARALAPGLDAAEAAEVAFRAERHRLGIGCGRLDPLSCAHETGLLLDWDRDRLTPLDLPELHLVVAFFSDAPGASAILRVLSESLDAGTGRVEAATLAWAELAREGARAGAEVGPLMNAAQQVYERELGGLVPAPGVTRACERLRAAGALGAKFTGAGGDRCVVALAEGAEHAEALGRELFGLGLEVLQTGLPGAGGGPG